ncbi:tryptophan 7-halogenase [Alteromonas sediminis]|uniref:Tryptophan 7-halogenase n=1 Tax=Alteromonas sediminis TaxID=2259342 RepID=A0A3N5YEA9_9ALTE|nr:tryptophan halogenase family protein [Alteromonas sediminis]RPJ68015.1 tryptophan 7-halogenase [Alteromonas sediminis]
MQHALRSICIVGGGTAGWMAATLLSNLLQRANIQITLIESPDIDTVGVGESTVPSIMDFLRACQIDLKEFVQSTSASFKLGIRFDDWLREDHQYFHPFGRVGHHINGFDFYQAWLQTKQAGVQTTWTEHSPCAQMAELGRFILRPRQPKSWTEDSIAHAIHLDALQAARYLRTQATEKGVIRSENTVTQVHQNAEGFIESLSLSDGSKLQSDFFIDCTGFNGLLINQALQVGYQDWSKYLPCNRAVVVQTENIATPQPFTVAKAQAAGWTWKIPLQHRTGNGYVFSSDYCSDDEAVQTLLSGLEGKPLNTPRFIPFTTGKRDKIWHKNCLALGLAAGFIEPLESTAIHIIYKTLIHFITHFPDRDFEHYNEAQFNRKVDADFEEIRDFIVMHYCTSERNDSEFWRRCTQSPLPASLQEKLSLFKQRGQLPPGVDELFTHESWYSVLEGMQYRPKKVHPLMATFNQQKLSDMMHANVKGIKEEVATMPSLHDFIQQHCPAKSAL